MKKAVILIVLAAAAMALIPLIGSVGVPEKEEAMIEEGSSTGVENKNSGDEGSGSDEKLAGQEDQNSFRILDTSTGETVTIPDREFCIGALAYEMPAGYEKEALKAQCVACYTYFCRLREKQQAEGATEDIKADLSKGQYYLSAEKMKEKWGDDQSEDIKKLTGTVDEVFGQTLCTEDGALAQVAYFAISSGVTENAEDIFGSECSTLQAVASPYDLSAPDFCTEKTVSKDEFIKKLSAKENETDMTIGEVKRTASGSVLSIMIGSKEWTGAEIRKLFGLRSANFELSEEEGGYRFIVYGYGHGVGMSQYGANIMAQQGSDYREILSHYYLNCTVRPSETSEDK